MVVEVCANSYISALNAQRAGAHRIELCSELVIGGITPSYGLIKRVVQSVSIPVYALIRPRSGNFTYSDDEFKIMKYDIAKCKEMGCAGIVSGLLNQDNSIDFERTKTLVDLARPLPFTFHRAFDWVTDPRKALQQLIELGVDRVLTSGQECSSEEGIALLSELKAYAEGRIGILPGGGINPNNVHRFKEAGFTEIHVSASTTEVVNEPPRIPMNSKKFFDETIAVYSDKNNIEAIVSAFN